MKIEWEDSDGISTATIGGVLLRVKRNDDLGGFELSMFLDEQSIHEDEIEGVDLAFAKRTAEATFHARFDRLIAWARGLLADGMTAMPSSLADDNLAMRDCIGALLPDRHALGRIAMGLDEPSGTYRFTVTVALREGNADAEAIERALVHALSSELKEWAKKIDATAAKLARSEIVAADARQEAISEALSLTEVWAANAGIDARPLLKRLQQRLRAEPMEQDR